MLETFLTAKLSGKREKFSSPIDSVRCHRHKKSKNSQFISNFRSLSISLLCLLSFSISSSRQRIDEWEANKFHFQFSISVTIPTCFAHQQINLNQWTCLTLSLVSRVYLQVILWFDSAFSSFLATIAAAVEWAIEPSRPCGSEVHLTTCNQERKPHEKFKTNRTKLQVRYFVAVVNSPAVLSDGFATNELGSIKPENAYWLCKYWISLRIR